MQLWDVPLPIYAKMLRLSSSIERKVIPQTQPQRNEYTGIYLCQNKFRATVVKDGKRVIIGRTNTEKEALKLQKEYARSVGKSLRDVVTVRKKPKKKKR